MDAAFNNLGELQVGARLGLFAPTSPAERLAYPRGAGRAAGGGARASQAAAEVTAPPAATPAGAGCIDPRRAAARGSPAHAGSCRAPTGGRGTAGRSRTRRAATDACPPAASPEPQPTVVASTLCSRRGARLLRRRPRRQAHPGDRAEIVLGREDVDIVLDDDLVSRRHAAIRPAAGGVEPVDLGSSNGTFVNWTRIDGPQLLQDGDTVHIGRVSFEVELSHPAS